MVVDSQGEWCLAHYGNSKFPPIKSRRPLSGGSEERAPASFGGTARLKFIFSESPERAKASSNQLSSRLTANSEHFSPIDVLDRFRVTGMPAAPRALASTSRRQSVEQDVALVRTLGEMGCCEPEENLSPHDTLVSKLKSRAARHEAEIGRFFLDTFRASVGRSTPAAQLKLDEQLDALIQKTEQQIHEIENRAEEIRVEMVEAEAALAKVNARKAELRSLSKEERSASALKIKAINEDFDAATAKFHQVKRKLQSDVYEMRDFRMLLSVYKKLRLDKIEESMRTAEDGHRLRACIRDYMRFGGQRILQKLETSAPVPLEPWMCEVLVNMCHVEVQLDDLEHRLLTIRQDALEPVKNQMQTMMSFNYEERFQILCDKTWHSAQSLRRSGESASGRFQHVGAGQRLSISNSLPVLGPVGASVGCRPAAFLGRSQSTIVDDLGEDSRNQKSMNDVGASSATPYTSVTDSKVQVVGSSPKHCNSPTQSSEWALLLPPVGANSESKQLSPKSMSLKRLPRSNLEPVESAIAARTPTHTVTEMRAVEAEWNGLKRLLDDMRQNVASVTCNRMRQAETQGMNARELADWGRAVLTMIVSEDFAKATLKKMKKAEQKVWDSRSS